MSWHTQLSKLKCLFTRADPTGDLAEEIRSHLKLEEQENLASGMSPAEARSAAARRFGNVTLTHERSRDAWLWTSAETLSKDLSFGLRQLRRNPGFTAVAVLTLARSRSPCHRRASLLLPPGPPRHQTANQ